MKKNKLRALGIVLLFMLAKLKYVIALLKWSKFGGTFITLFVSLGAYATAYGWKFGIAIIYLLLIHEIGHFVASKVLKINTSPIFFIPFLGAVINMKDKPKNAKAEAIMAYGGPLAGLISIIPALVLYFATKDTLWAAIFTVGAFLNLFNLMPVSPLDGGRIIGAVSPKVWFVGMIMLIAYAVIRPNAIIFLILFFGVMTLWDTFKKERGAKAFSILREDNLKFHKEILAIKNKIADILDDVEKKYVINIKRSEINERVNVVKEQYDKRKKSWFIPYKDDNKYIQSMRISNEYNYLCDLENCLRNYSGYFVSGLLSKIEEISQGMDKVIQETNSYYLTSKKDKVTVLLAYVALAIVLFIIYQYGSNILAIHKSDL